MASVKFWANAQNLQDQDDKVIPVLSDDVHTPKTTPDVQQIEINPKKERYNQNDTIAVLPVLKNSSKIAQIDYFLNEEYVGSVKTSPFMISIPLSLFIFTTNTAKIRLQIYDAVGNKSEYTTTIPLN